MEVVSQSNSDQYYTNRFLREVCIRILEHANSRPLDNQNAGKTRKQEIMNSDVSGTCINHGVQLGIVEVPCKGLLKYLASTNPISRH